MYNLPRRCFIIEHTITALHSPRALMTSQSLLTPYLVHGVFNVHAAVAHAVADFILIAFLPGRGAEAAGAAEGAQGDGVGSGGPRLHLWQLLMLQEEGEDG